MITKRVIVISILCILLTLFLGLIIKETPFVKIIQEKTNGYFDNEPSAAENIFGNSPGNILNFGMVAQTEDWIYYSNSLDGWGLYKIKTDGTQKTKLTDYPVRFINIIGSWVCFSDFVFEEPTYLIKIKTDGTDQTIISKDPAYTVIVKDNWIYYVNGNDGLIYRIDINGNNKSKLMDIEVNGFTILNNYIFYKDSSNNKIYKKEIFNEQLTLVVDKKVEQFVVVNGWVYYVNLEDNNGLYKITIDGKNDVKLTDDIVTYLNVMDNWVFYTNHSDKGNIYRIDTSGNNKRKLIDERGIEIHVINDWVYYKNSHSLLYRVRKDGTQRQLVE